MILINVMRLQVILNQLLSLLIVTYLGLFFGLDIEKAQYDAVLAVLMYLGTSAGFSLINLRLIRFFSSSKPEQIDAVIIIYISFAFVLFLFLLSLLLLPSMNGYIFPELLLDQGLNILVLCMIHSMLYFILQLVALKRLALKKSKLLVETLQSVFKFTFIINSIYTNNSMLDVLHDSLFVSIILGIIFLLYFHDDFPRSIKILPILENIFLVVSSPSIFGLLVITSFLFLIVLTTNLSKQSVEIFAFYGYAMYASNFLILLQGKINAVETLIDKATLPFLRLHYVNRWFFLSPIIAFFLVITHAGWGYIVDADHYLFILAYALVFTVTSITNYWVAARLYLCDHTNIVWLNASVGYFAGLCFILVFSGFGNFIFAATAIQSTITYMLNVRAMKKAL